MNPMIVIAAAKVATAGTVAGSTVLLASSAFDEHGQTIIGLLAALTAMASVLGGLRLRRRTTNESDLKSMRQRVAVLEMDMQANARWQFAVTTTAAQNGWTLPAPPQLLSTQLDNGASTTQGEAA